MAKQLKIETLERAKQRVKSAFKPEEADPVVRFISGGKMGLKHLMSEKVVVQPEYDKIELPGKEDLVVATKDGMDGFVSQSGKKGIPCIYKFAEGFGCSRALVKKSDGEQLFIDENGDFVFALGPGVSAHGFENGMVTLYSNKLEAVADKSGRKIVPFCKMVDRHDDYIVFRNEDDKWGACDAEGRLVIPCEYDWITIFDDCIRVRKNDLFGLFSKEGKQLTPFEFRYIEKLGFCPGLYHTCDSTESVWERWDSAAKHGLINSKGEVLLEQRYKYMKPVHWYDPETEKFYYLTNAVNLYRYRDGYEIVRLDGSEKEPVDYKTLDNVIKSDLERKEYVPQEKYKHNYPDYTYQSESGLFGLKSLKGEKLTEAIYIREMYQFYHDPLLFETRQWSEGGICDRVELFGVIDEKGHEVVPCEYRKLEENGGLIRARNKSGKYGILTLDGKTLVKCAYYSCYVDTSSKQPSGVIIARAKARGTDMLFNLDGELIIDQGRFDDIRYSIDGLMQVRDANDPRSWYYIDLWGGQKPIRR